jgi:hypothetical protein
MPHLKSGEEISGYDTVSDAEEQEEQPATPGWLINCIRSR